MDNNTSLKKSLTEGRTLLSQTINDGSLGTTLNLPLAVCPTPITTIQI